MARRARQIEGLLSLLRSVGCSYPGSDVDLSDYFDKHSAAALAESMDPKALSSVKWFIDCGDDDFLFEGNSLIHIAFKKKDVPHEYRVRDGGAPFCSSPRLGLKGVQEYFALSNHVLLHVTHG